MMSWETEHVVETSDNPYTRDNFFMWLYRLMYNNRIELYDWCYQMDEISVSLRSGK